ncbi:MAG TPA: tetratricopeptide repeat protein [Gemmatimonadales bacterium]|nr:tetratricopeptide repeat protein [Gemmatimonadales bacterium]
MRRARAISVGSRVLLSLAPLRLPAQSVEYRSPAGVEYRSQPDTGAVARAESVLAKDPRNVDKIIALGVAQSGVRQYREAIETFSRGLKIAPNNALLYRWRGHRYLSVREFDRAMADLQRGAKQTDTIYGIWYHLGIVRFAKRDFAGAADAFNKALPMAPDSAERAGATDWLWMSLSRAGRAADAKALLDRHPDKPNGANAYAQRLRLYRGEIEPDSVFTKADTSDIAIATLSYGVGNWYLLRGDTARARSYFQRSVASGGWPAFGFIMSEVELRTLPPPALETPQQVTLRMIDAMRANDWQTMAALMDPRALHQLREFLSILFDTPNVDQIRKELLGVSTVAEAQALSDTAMFEALLRYTTKSNPELGDVFRSAKVQILGQVNEGPDTAHVVYRMQMTVEGTPVTTMDVVSLTRSAAGWRGLLKADMSAFAAAIRAAIQREQAGPAKPNEPPQDH